MIIFYIAAVEAPAKFSHNGGITKGDHAMPPPASPEQAGPRRTPAGLPQVPKSNHGCRRRLCRRTVRAMHAVCTHVRGVLFRARASHWLRGRPRHMLRLPRTPPRTARPERPCGSPALSVWLGRARLSQRRPSRSVCTLARRDRHAALHGPAAQHRGAHVRGSPHTCMSTLR